MYKWLQFIDNKSRRYWNQKRYIIVNKPVDNSYLGWKPSRKDSYIVSLDNTGAIEYYYTFSDGVWQKYKDSTNGENPIYDSFDLTVTTEYGGEDSTVEIKVDSPNEYTQADDKVTHKTVADVKLTLTAVPDEGYEFGKWTVNGEDLTDTSSTVTIEVNDDTTVVAKFDSEQ